MLNFIKPYNTKIFCKMRMRIVEAESRSGDGVLKMENAILCLFGWKIDDAVFGNVRVIFLGVFMWIFFYFCVTKCIY